MTYDEQPNDGKYITVSCNDETEWLEKRRGWLGGSDIAAVLGYSKYKTSLDVYLSKVQGISNEESLQLSIGHMAEDLNHKIYEKVFGEKLVNPGDYTFMCNLDTPFIAVTLDRILEKENIPHEMKNVFGYNINPDIWIKKVPVEYWIQCQFQMHCTGSNNSQLCALFPGYQIRVARIKRNQKFLDLAIEKLENFWIDTINMIEPRVKSYKDLSAVKKLRKNSVEGIKELDIETEIDVDSLLKVKKMQKKLKERRDFLEAKIISSLCYHSEGILPSERTVSFKENKAGKRILRVKG